MKLYYRNIGRMVVCLLFVGVITDAMACLTTFINDKGKRVIIYNKNDKAIIPVSRNEKRRFGNQHKHAHFVIYIQQPKSPFFSRVYVCKQNICGKKGNILLKLSDIEDQTDATQLFTITKSEPHASMVEELPMFKKKNCHSCPSTSSSFAKATKDTSGRAD